MTHHHLLTFVEIKSPMHGERNIQAEVRIEFTYDPDTIEDNPFHIVDVVYKDWQMKAWTPMPQQLREFLDIEEAALTPKFESVIASIPKTTEEPS